MTIRPTRDAVVAIALIGMGAAWLDPGAALGQSTGDIRGIVSDARSKQPIVGAEVAFVQVEFTATTDDRGRYSMAGIPAGRYTLLVRGIGFKPALASDKIVYPDTVNVLDFELDPTVTALEEVEVVGSEDPRRSTYAVNLLTRADLPDNEDLLLALEGRVPGLNLARGVTTTGTEERDARGVQLRGSERDVLFVIDGTVIAPPLTFTINTSEVLCVEIRRGASAAMRYARNIRGGPRQRGYSGVVLVWTLGTRSPAPENCVSG